MPTADSQERVLSQVEAATEEQIDFTQRLVRLPTVNPPGRHYRDGARLIGDQLQSLGFEVDYLSPDPSEHPSEFPRVNVVGLRQGPPEGTTVHLNGHFDVVPPGDGWTRDPFSGLVENGRLHGRGSADMKGGLAAAIFAAAALLRSGVRLDGSLEVSGTVDEESGGFAGVAWLAEQGRLTSERVDHVIIPEPFGVDRICTGHRGVYWFKVESHGVIGHGSMPFLGVNAIENPGPVLEAFRTRLQPKLAERRTAMPVVPPEARRATLNINAILGGQAGMEPQTPCVADHCEVIFDRRFLPEEGFESTREEIESLLRQVEEEGPQRRYTLTDLMVVHPVQAPPDSALTRALQNAILEVVETPATLVASPGTYDQKHVTRIGGIESCVAYGPGELELAHQPDESCSVDDLVTSTKVMALALLELVGGD